jgi:hypothetical protein
MKHWFVLPFLLFAVITSSAQNRAPEIQFRHPANLKAGELYNFTIQLLRNGNTGGCLLDFEFPFGYVVNEQKSEDALFSFSDSKLEYQWIILPEKDTLILEFALLIPDNAAGSTNITGNIAYTLNDVRIETSIVPLQINVESQQSASVVIKDSKSPVDQKINEAQSHTPEPKSTEREVIKYKIQIGAFKSPVNLTTLASQFGIPVSGIIEFKHQGLYKYAFGSFSNPAEARNSIKKYPQLKDKAFVIGFRNGKRVELDETIEGFKEENE